MCIPVKHATDCCSIYDFPSFQYCLSITGLSKRAKSRQSLQDTVYNEAVSTLARQKLGMVPAQQSFSKLMRLSLPNYL